jgi:hypothetical protein
VAGRSFSLGTATTTKNKFVTTKIKTTKMHDNKNKNIKILDKKK